MGFIGGQLLEAASQLGENEQEYLVMFAEEP
jgi:hypothetical protein